jgi:hypothetical protein
MVSEPEIPRPISSDPYLFVIKQGYFCERSVKDEERTNRPFPALIDFCGKDSETALNFTNKSPVNNMV